MVIFIFYFRVFEEKKKTSRMMLRSAGLLMTPLNYSARLRQYLYFCTSKASKLRARTHSVSARLRQYLYFCTSTKYIGTVVLGTVVLVQKTIFP
jgi:predicted SprT family Zn-dependent metalloprotease